MAGEIEIIGKLKRKDEQAGGPVLPVLNANQVEGLETDGQTGLPALVAYTQAGARLDTAQDVREAVAFAGASGRVVANRPVKSGGVLDIPAGCLIDLQENSLNLSTTVARFGDGAKIINNRLIFNGRLAPNAGCLVMEVQGGIVAARVRFILSFGVCVYNHVTVHDFGQSNAAPDRFTRGPATEGPGTVVLRNGSQFYGDYAPDPATTVQVEEVPFPVPVNTVNGFGPDAAGNVVVTFFPFTTETSGGNLITQPSTATGNTIGEEAHSRCVFAGNRIDVTDGNNRIGLNAKAGANFYNNGISGAGAAGNSINGTGSVAANSISGSNATSNSISGDTAQNNSISGDNSNNNIIIGSGSFNNSISGNNSRDNKLTDCVSCNLQYCSDVTVISGNNLTLIACTDVVNAQLPVTGPATFINDLRIV